MTSRISSLSPATRRLSLFFKGMKKKNLLQRVIIIAIVTLASLYVVIGPRHRPTRNDFTWSGIKNNLRENIHLGLDLRGGSHLGHARQDGRVSQKAGDR